MSTSFRWLVVAIVAGVVAIAAAVASAAESSAVATAQSSSEPIYIAVNVPIDTPAYNFPQAFAGAGAAARAINAVGGIKGRKVAIITCNTKTDPGQEVACARQAASKGALAAVASYPVANGDGYEQALRDASIAEIAPPGTSPAQFDGKTTFPLEFGPGNYAACASKAIMKATGAKSIASVTIDVPAAQVYDDLVSKAAKSAGVQYNGDVKMPIANADAASVVQQVASKGNPDLVVLILGGSQVVPFVTASQALGKKWAYCASPNITGGATMLALGGAASNFYQGAALPPLTLAKTNKFMRRFVTEMALEQAAGDSAASTSLKDYNVTGLRAWLGVQVVAQVAREMTGPITGTRFLAALRKSKFDSGGALPLINFTKCTHGGTYACIYNPYVTLQKWDSSTNVWNVVPVGYINAVKGAYGS
jgi:ABC-type branched-subunit amino acid transport system substrate-binding protein